MHITVPRGSQWWNFEMSSILCIVWLFQRSRWNKTYSLERKLIPSLNVPDIHKKCMTLGQYGGADYLKKRFLGLFHLKSGGHYYFFICLTLLHGNCCMLPSNAWSCCLRDSGWWLESSYATYVYQETDLLPWSETAPKAKKMESCSRLHDDMNLNSMVYADNWDLLQIVSRRQAGNFKCNLPDEKL